MQFGTKATAIAFVLAACGCESHNAALAPVDGRVTIDDAPLSAFVVNFSPVGNTLGSGALGSTDADGRFVLIDVRGETGAHPGEYKISFYPMLAADASSDDPAAVVARGDNSSAKLATGSARLRELYINPNLTPLRAMVPESGGAVQIRLTSTGQGATAETTPASHAHHGESKGAQ